MLKKNLTWQYNFVAFVKHCCKPFVWSLQMNGLCSKRRNSPYIFQQGSGIPTNKSLFIWTITFQQDVQTWNVLPCQIRRIKGRHLEHHRRSSSIVLSRSCRMGLWSRSSHICSNCNTIRALTWNCITCCISNNSYNAQVPP